jgi:hypothetical protein
MKKIRIIMASAFMVAILGALVSHANGGRPSLVQYYVKPGGTGACVTTTCIPTGTGAVCSVNDTYWTKSGTNDCGTQQFGTFNLPS